MENEFGPVLQQLDGTTLSDYVDFFFHRDLIDSSVLRFCGINEQHDFMEWAVELGCLPNMTHVPPVSARSEEEETPQSELCAEIQRVRADEQARARQTMNAPRQSNQLNKHVIESIRRLTEQQNAIRDLRIQLKNVVHAGVRAFLNAKIQRAQRALEKQRACVS